MNLSIKLDEIIHSLKEQAVDKRDFVNEADPDDIFLQDIKMLLIAAEVIEALRQFLLSLNQYAL